MSEDKIKIGDKDYPTRPFKDGMIPQEKDSFNPEDYEQLKKDSRAMGKKIMEAKKDDFFDFSYFDITRGFCQGAATGLVPHFVHRKEFFQRKLEQLDEAEKYKFADEFVQLHIEKITSEFVYKHVPFHDMWVECRLDIDDIVITGIHLMTVKVNEQNQQVYDNDIFVPMGFTKDDISIFITGYDHNGTQFYDYFTFERASAITDGRGAKYICPFCSNPVKKLEATRYYCDNENCVHAWQNDNVIIFDVSNKIAKKHLTDISDVHKAEDKVRNFVASMLDYLMMPEVHQHVMFNEKELKERNEKRAKRAKKPLSNFRVIRVSGSVDRYIEMFKNQFNGDYERARNETKVKAHYFRFWKKSKWCKLYEHISKCNTDAEIIARLEKLVRSDEDGLPVPKMYQYRWDWVNKVIMVMVDVSIRNEGLGKKRDTIRVISSD